LFEFNDQYVPTTAIRMYENTKLRFCLFVTSIIWDHTRHAGRAWIESDDDDDDIFDYSLVEFAI